MEKQIYIVGACRTGIGAYQGQYTNISATKLGGIVIEHALERAKISPGDVSEVIMGQVLTAGHGQNPARQAAIIGKIRADVPAHTINMACGSGLKAIYDAFVAIKAGQASIIVAGGQENMTQAKHCAFLRDGHKVGSFDMEDTIVTDALIDSVLNEHMGAAVDKLAARLNVTRQRQDEFAQKSQIKVVAAIKNGYFNDEMVAVDSMELGVLLKEDEIDLAIVPLERLRTRPSTFDERKGTITADNSAGIKDGAAAVVLTNGYQVKSRKLTPLARIVAFSNFGLDPRNTALAPVNAIKEVLEKANWFIGDVDLFEINETFAAQCLIIIDKLVIDPAKVNISGGAIVLGHPIAASGARILVTLLYNMKRTKKTKGIATLCVGGGLAIAIAIQID